MSFGRYESSTLNSGKKLPAEWTESFTKTLTESYYDQSEKDFRFFDVYGQIYKEEFIVIVSYIHHDDHLSSPISLFLSHDILEDDKDFKKVLENLVDLTGHIYDDIFAQENWAEYSSNWTPNDFRKSNFYYKITRENISLTLQAEELLKKDGQI